MITAEQIRAKIDKFLSDTVDGRALSEKCRDYYDGKQWTDTEDAILRKRKQAPITVNRVKPKVEGLLGVYNVRKSDPKAFPRTKKHEKSSYAMTDALRYVADVNEFDQIKLDVAENFFIEGYGGAIVDVVKKKEVEVRIRRVPWDRIYYDTHSREKDYSDARWKGLIIWLDEEQAVEMLPGIPVETLYTDQGDETFQDKPRWSDTENKRIRVALHYELIKGVWHMAMISGLDYVVPLQVSPLLDDDGNPACPIELISANVDRDNLRYGEVKSFLDQQDEINHRRSKFLHMLSQRQTHGRKGAIKDIPKMKKELSKPDGHVEWDGDKFGDDFGVIPTGDMGNAQYNLYQDAKRELDAISLNAQLSGERQGDLSGKAIDKLQQAGAIELNRQYALLAGWEKRIYRQIWGRIRQFWTEEKWIRLTDNQDTLRWVGFNTPLTARQLMEEKINDESLPLMERKKYAASYTFLTQAEQSQNPQEVQAASQQLEAIVGVTNPVAELDMDIILDQSFDVVNIQQEQFQLLTQFAQGSDVDIIDLIELSDLRNKDALIQKIETRRQQAGASEQEITEGRLLKDRADTFKKSAEADKLQAEANQTKLQNQLLLTQPPKDSGVVI